MLVKSPVRGKKRKYDSDDIKDMTDISSATVNPEIDVGLVYKKLTDSAWAKASRAVSVKKQLGLYYCSICNEECESEDRVKEGARDSVMCNSCMEWIHIHDCSGERRKPRSVYWYCSSCKNV